MKYKSQSIKKQADLYTPVGLFYKLRNHFNEVLLLESSDYSSKEDSLSFLVCDLLEGFEVKDNTIQIKSNLDSIFETMEVTELVSQFETYFTSFDIKQDEISGKYNGLFGFTAFDAIKYFDTNIYDQNKSGHQTPDVKYGFYRYIIVIDHVSDILYIVENIPECQESTMNNILSIIDNPNIQIGRFKVNGDILTNMTDDEFRGQVKLSKEHCQRGDVFQIVPSRRFEQSYLGDAFNVYRKLRSINPSPYLFYFDYGNYSIFGSSPEAQMIVKDRIAEIHPIAGTVKRTGDVEGDAIRAQELMVNPKENAEHIMLVDLARNDLSKNTSDVYVSKYRELQQFSHVFHLVSIVKGKLKDNKSSFQVFADTFPAGTLSGAPKYKAIQLIDDMEPTKRGYYGGGIGVINFNGNLNHAIMIRSFLAINNKLYFQAGAGVVIDSTPEGELQEVNTKLAALRKALVDAESLNN